MNQKQRSYYFLLFCLVAALLVIFLIIRPFLNPLILGAIFAFLFQPLYKKILRLLWKQRSVAAFITMIIAIILVILPIMLLGVQIFKELNQLYQTVVNDDKDIFLTMIENSINQARVFLLVPDNFQIDFSQYLQQGIDTLIRNIGSIFSSFAGILLDFFVFLVAFYFLLKDGHKLKNYIINLSPLDDSDDEIIASRFKLAISSVVKGNLVIGIIQGALTGIGFTLFGVPNAVLWGSVAAIAAVLPGIGTTLVLTPAIIFLFITGNIFGSAGLLIWGITAVGLIDNFLGPILVGNGMQMHPLLVFIAIIGGIAFFGPLGFLLGPLAMSPCLAIIEIYFSLKEQKNKIV
ncbi:MAG: AI-2E family transporter [bacterium]|nr:AI-2E family transporter [bacterium]